MPRGRKNNRGGARRGMPGKAYSNRLDLNKPKLQVVPAQRAVPVAPPPTQTAPTPGPGLAAAQAYQFPELAPIDRPTEFRDEPVTAGIDMGPGPGSEIFGRLFNPPRAGDLLAYLASLPIATQEVKDLAFRVGQPRRGVGLPPIEPEIVQPLFEEPGPETVSG
jgi:hypothetical protein